MNEITLESIEGKTFYFFQGVAHEFLTEAVCVALELGITPVFKF